MAHSAVFAVTCLIAAIVLLVHTRGNVFAIVAVAAAAIETLLAFGLLHLSVARLPLGLILAGALTLTGIVLYLRVTARDAVGAATIVAFIGMLQLLIALRIL